MGFLGAYEGACDGVLDERGESERFDKLRELWRVVAENDGAIFLAIWIYAMYSADKAERIRASRPHNETENPQ